MDFNDYGFLLESLEFVDNEHDCHIQDVLKAFTSAGSDALKTNLRHFVGNSIEDPEGRLVKLLIRWSKQPESFTPPTKPISSDRMDSHDDDPSQGREAAEGKQSATNPQPNAPLVKVEPTDAPSPGSNDKETETSDTQPFQQSVTEIEEFSDEQMSTSPSTTRPKRKLSKNLNLKPPDKTPGEKGNYEVSSLNLPQLYFELNRENWQPRNVARTLSTKWRGNAVEYAMACSEK